ncbi:ABC transporter permease [Aeromicrobium sp. P5_D10]
MSIDTQTEPETRPAQHRTGARSDLMAWLRNSISVVSLVVFLIVLVAVFGSTAPGFLTVDNFLIILSSVAVIGIVSLGQTAAIISGGFDLSISGLIPMGAIVFAKMLNAGHSFALSLLVVMLVGAAFGLVNGLLVTKLRISPLIATLGILSVAIGMAQSVAGGITVPFDDPQVNILARSSIGGVSNSVWVLLVLAVGFTLMLRFTTFGRSMYAIGGNAESSWLAGIRVDRTVSLIYVISATLASLAGAVLASQLLAGSTNLGRDAALTAITAVVLGGGSLAGGSGTVLGTMIGVLVLGTFQNGLTIKQIDPFYQQIATGLVLLLAVAFSQLRQGKQRT